MHLSQPAQVTRSRTQAAGRKRGAGAFWGAAVSPQGGMQAGVVWKWGQPKRLQDICVVMPMGWECYQRDTGLTPQPCRSPKVHAPWSA